MLARAGYTIFIIIFVGVVAWSYPSLPTSLARYVWDNWHAGGLALAFDRDDARLAFVIGAYYFGNQFATSAEEEHLYDMPFAQKAFGKAILINPAMPLAHYMRARVEFIRSDFAKALSDLNKELALYPENKRTLYMRGLVYAYRGRSGDLIRAEEDFRSFVAWAPREWAGYNDLAFVLAKGRRYEDAATVLREGIVKADGGAENPWLWDALGVMELNQGNPGEAIKALANAQTFATSLTDSSWQRAYPGNNPTKAHSGVEAMQIGIARNLAAAYDAAAK